MSSLRAGGARPAILDPYPGFERSLLPSLCNLSTLHSYQLALVPFHPEATPSQIAQAKLLFQQRRLAAVARREQLGLPEKQAELRQLERAKDWLEGKVPGSKKMKDGGSQTEERLFTLAEVKERIANVSRLAVERALSEQRDKYATEISRAVDMAVEEEKERNVERTKEACEAAVKLHREEAMRRVNEMAERARARLQAEQEAAQQPPRAPSPSPALAASPHLPSPPLDEESPLGPVFHFDSSDRGKPPVELLKLLFIVRIDKVASIVTPQLFLHFMLRRQGLRFPRPLGISKTAAGAMMVGFQSRAAAERAVKQLDGQTLPLVKCAMSAVLIGAGAHIFRWHHLSEEVEREWRAHQRLPTAEWVEKIPGPGKGVKVSEGYHAEWKRIHAAKANERSEEEKQEMERVQQQTRSELERYRQGQERAPSQEEVADVLGTPFSRSALRSGYGPSFASSSYDFSLPSSSSAPPPHQAAPSPAQSISRPPISYRSGNALSFQSGAPPTRLPPRPSFAAAFSHSPTPLGDSYVNKELTNARPNNLNGLASATSGVPSSTGFSSAGLWPRSDAPNAALPTANSALNLPALVPSRRRPPPPPPPPPLPTSSASSQGGANLPFSLPSSSAYAPLFTPTPYVNPLARTWDQQQQRDEPTVDPRKRARFG